MPSSYNEQLEKDIAEVQAEHADPADYLPEDSHAFAPWDEESSEEDEKA